MAQKTASASLIVILVLLALVATAANLSVFFDLPWLHDLRLAEITPNESEEEREGEVPPGLRSSIFLVHLDRCDGQGWTSGTGFVLVSGYLVTCAHVVGDNLACGSEIRLTGPDGIDQPAVLEGYSDIDDLALLKVNDSSYPPLALADSTLYENSDDVLSVYTVGYPLVGAASTPERASLSGVGSISQYDRSKNLFITSGLVINAGNSGGPVLFEEERIVLGVASAKLDPTVGDGIGYVIPSKTVKDFFFQKTGRELP